jgi:hypothetical protein
VIGADTCSRAADHTERYAGPAHLAALRRY